MSNGRGTLAGYLIEKTGPMWSPEKTKVTAMTEGIAFLGFAPAPIWMNSTATVCGLKY
ncbi:MULTISPECIES: hypothetical protein [unclassified Rhizobium]|uniref:hypothetical protein n=1 Tax=unclassified Rhizobium TaxID=2613769 RepID=UPI00129A8FDC|nr:MULTISPECIES: hypothetical protein [unclassified Rhizobium]